MAENVHDLRDTPNHKLVNAPRALKTEISMSFLDKAHISAGNEEWRRNEGQDER